jgi:ORF6N domain
MAALSLPELESRVLFVRGHRVMLDSTLAELYGVETKMLLRAVRRNIDRFPGDFMFQLTAEEFEGLRSQIGISKTGAELDPTPLRFQIGTSNAGRGGRRYRPYAFTEQGVAMLSSVLRSDRALKVNIEIMRAFVRLRQLLAGNADLTRRLDELEGRYDQQFKVVFDAIRQIVAPPHPPRRQLGFQPPSHDEQI